MNNTNNKTNSTVTINSTKKMININKKTKSMTIQRLININNNNNKIYILAKNKKWNLKKMIVQIISSNLSNRKRETRH